MPHRSYEVPFAFPTSAHQEGSRRRPSSVEPTASTSRFPHYGIGTAWADRVSQSTTPGWGNSRGIVGIVYEPALELPQGPPGKPHPSRWTPPIPRAIVGRERSKFLLGPDPFESDILQIRMKLI